MESTLPSAETLLERLSSRKDDRPPPPIATEQQVQLAVAAALDRKAEDLRVLELRGVSDFTDYFLILDGRNERQVEAIAEAVSGVLSKAGVKPLHVEGRRHARWVLMDYGGDMVVHIFHRDARGFYALERLWSDAPDVTERFADGDGAVEE
ncbi:MAG: ribosome silencing factor, partial [Holophagales bacterium]|nr:ribosome silencing factor [Holophagales bacterium]